VLSCIQIVVLVQREGLNSPFGEHEAEVALLTIVRATMDDDYKDPNMDMSDDENEDEDDDTSDDDDDE